MQSVSSLYSVSSSSVLDIPADLHTLRLNANSPSLSLIHSTPPALADHHLPSYDLIADNDMEQLSLEIEKERFVIYDFNHHLFLFQT